MTIRNCIKSCYNFYCDSDFSFKEHDFIDFRLIKTNSGHHFHFICLCKTNMSIDFGTKIFQLNKYNTVYSCGHTFLILTVF